MNTFHAGQNEENMCGRYSMIATKEQVHAQLPFVKETNISIHESYNVAPTQEGLVVTNEQPFELQYLEWGLVPSWSNNGKNQGKLINARAESIFSKASFRVPIRQKRCLIIADSFYEWRRSGTQKLPYRIFPKDGSLLIMAGIWDEWKQYEEVKQTFSIITTTPNAEMSNLHNRAPVVLTDALECQLWLDKNSLEDINALLQPLKDDFFKIHPVSQMVNSVRNNSPHLHEEVPEELDLFSQE